MVNGTIAIGNMLNTDTLRKIFHCANNVLCLDEVVVLATLISYTQVTVVVLGLGKY